MKPAIFRCQTTGQFVQHRGDDAPSGTNVYEAILCPVCQRVHLINLVTGRALGEREPLRTGEEKPDPGVWRFAEE